MPQRLDIEKVNEAHRLRLEKDDDGKFLTQQAIAKKMNMSLRQIVRYLDPDWVAERTSASEHVLLSYTTGTTHESKGATVRVPILGISSEATDEKLPASFAPDPPCEVAPPASVAVLQDAGLPPARALQVFSDWRRDHGLSGLHRECREHRLLLLLLNDNVPANITDALVRISRRFSWFPPGLYPGDEIIQLYKAYRPWESDHHRAHYLAALFNFEVVGDDIRIYSLGPPLKVYFQALREFYRSPDMYNDRVSKYPLNELGILRNLVLVEVPRTLFFFSEHEVLSSQWFEETLAIFNEFYLFTEERESEA